MSKTAKRKSKKLAAATAATAGAVTKPSHASLAATKSALRAAGERVTSAFRVGKWEEALAALVALRAAGHTPAAVIVNKVITAAGRKGQWRTALELLQQMRPGGGQGPASGVKATAVSYSATLLFCGQAGEVETALRVLDWMRDDGVAPDAISFNAAISACRSAATERWRDAAALLAAARAAGVADIVTHNALLGVLDKAGQWQVALGLLKEMCAAAAADAQAPSAGGAAPKAGVSAPNGVSFATAIAACAAARQADEALRLLRVVMPAANVAPSVHASNAALTACERAGRWEDALALLAAMERDGPPPDEVTVRSALFACCAAAPPRIAEALALFRRVEAGAFPGVRRNAVTQNLLVRACDVAGEGTQALAMLEGFLRSSDEAAAAPAGAHAAPVTQLTGGAAAAADAGGRVVRHPVWCAPPLAAGPAAATAAPPAGAGAEAVPSPDAYAGQFWVVHHEAGWQRRPKNKHDLNIYTAQPGMVSFEDDDAVAPHVTRHDVPGVPGAFMVSGVLTRGECAQLVAASEAMGYTRDEPTLRGGSGASSAGVAAVAAGTGTGRSAGEAPVPAAPEGEAAAATAAAATAAAAGAASGSAQDGIDNCVWLVDDSILSHIWTRCAPHLPPAVCGAALAGVNARFRLFRYAPGAVYRPHVDGAWPGSGVGADGRYVYDRFRDRWSKLTFLIYLNDSEASADGGGGDDADAFSGGETVFYTPAPGAPGALDARGVAPRVGAVLVFPHGDTPGSLVHEGSAVARGLKYVARSDVLFKTPPPAR
jgi:pentatricopeptide repeat protein